MKKQLILSLSLVLISFSTWASQECFDVFNEGVLKRRAAGGFYSEAGTYYVKAEKETDNVSKKKFYEKVLKWCEEAIVSFTQSDQAFQVALLKCPQDTHGKISGLQDSNRTDLGIIIGFMEQIRTKLNTKDLLDLDN